MVSPDDMEERTGCPNDKAKSMKLCYAKKGTKVRVYPSRPKPGVQGSEIYVDRDMGNRCQTVDRFMESKVYCEVNVNYIAGNDKISSFDVTYGNKFYYFLFSFLIFYFLLIHLQYVISRAG